MRIKVFISYAHADQRLHRRLLKHLSPLERQERISIWQDLEIPPGADWRNELHTHLNEADLILVLVSSDFIVSNFCWNEELQVALRRHGVGTVSVIPIILRPAAWQETPLERLQAVPEGGKPVTEWSNQDTAFKDVVLGIERVVRSIELRIGPEPVHSALRSRRRLIKTLIPLGVGAIGAGIWYVLHLPVPPSLSLPSGMVWQRQTSDASQQWYGITVTSALCVAAGSNGHILTSPNGRIWAPQPTGTHRSLRGAAWSGFQFVAVGDNGAILSSPDGLTWTSRNTHVLDNLEGVTWSGSQFVVVGDNGTILTSPDGLTWTLQNSDVYSALFDIVWSGSLFVAVGLGGVMCASPDGNAWTAFPPVTPQDLRGVTWSSSLSLFVAVGDTGTILTSTSGNSWTHHDYPMNIDLRGVTWSSSLSLFVAVGTNHTVLTSSDGRNWILRAVPAQNDLEGVACLGIRFVAVGDGGTILTSS